MKAITEEEKLESRVYKNEAGGDGDENEAEVEGDGDSCTEVESSEIGDDPGDGNPKFSKTEDGEKLKQNSASSGFVVMQNLYCTMHGLCTRARAS
ncbi:hypothetical protein U1Q18_012592 [Sarracenia purpurea var. burkii]